MLAAVLSTSASIGKPAFGFAADFSFGNASRNDFFTSFTATRSCGRDGPARLDSTVPMSSSRTSVYVAGGVVASWNKPCALQYASTNASCSSLRPVWCKYFNVSASTGKMPHVAPYSGAMFAIVKRSASASSARPGPKNSTNLPTTPFLRRICVTVSTRSVAVVPSVNLPDSLKPTTCGMSIVTGWPSIAASASMPPTPQPSTPRPLTIVVCESVPTSVSG